VWGRGGEQDADHAHVCGGERGKNLPHTSQEEKREGEKTHVDLDVKYTTLTEKGRFPRRANKEWEKKTGKKQKEISKRPAKITWRRRKIVPEAS